MAETGYALDLLSPVRHVATELDRVAPAALSLGDLAAGYRHPNPSDLVRVRQHEGCETDHDAVLWLMNQAIELIERRGKSGAVQIVAENGGYRLADGLTFKDLRYGGKALHKTRDDHAQFRDPFNPMSGRFSENVRRNTGKDTMDDLRESMRSFGWLEEFPAIKDERGVVLVGHRRLAVAAELEITPVTKTVRLGDGDEADAKRFALAVASNLGAKAFTPEERKDIAEYLYGEREWTQERIAEALKVSQSTVQRDLEGLPTAGKPPARPKGGRPKSRKAPPGLEQKIRSQVEAGEPIHKDELAEEFGVGSGVVYSAHQRAIGAVEEARREQETPPTSDEAPVPEAPDSTCTCPTCGDVHQR